jgi:hypothetical protein
MPEYTHTLIPTRPDFVPEPEQVGAFLGGLIELGAVPMEPTLKVGKLSGKFRTFHNRFTGKSEPWPEYTPIQVTDTAAIPDAVRGVIDYKAFMIGMGPPRVPPLPIDFSGNYHLDVCCRLHSEIVSTSDWHDEFGGKRNVPFFGLPCGAESRTGYFLHPQTGAPIEVPMAGCARFYVEFELGKMLFPSITDSLAILEPSIVELGRHRFGVEFVQGCHWCA